MDNKSQVEAAQKIRQVADLLRSVMAESRKAGIYASIKLSTMDHYHLPSDTFDIYEEIDIRSVTIF